METLNIQLLILYESGAAYRNFGTVFRFVVLSSMY